MRKLWILCLVWVLLFCGCTKEEIDSRSLMQQIILEYSTLPFGEIVYHSEAMPGEKAYMTPRLQSLLYDNGRERSIHEWEGVVNYAVNLADGQYGMEIHIFCMKSVAEARNMEKLLQRRLELLQRRSLYLYAPDAYDIYFSSAKVCQEKNYVFLLATGENERIGNLLASWID